MQRSNRTQGNDLEPANVTKELFCRAVHQETGVALEHVQAIVHLLLGEMRKEILNRHQVKIGNFGIFEMIEPKPRRIQNVVSGLSETVSVPPLLKFRIKRTLKAFLLRRLRKS